MRFSGHFLHKLLALVLAVSTLSAISVVSAPIANALTTGSGVCTQDYAVTGTGELSVTQNGGYCYVAFKNTGAVNTQTSFTWTRPTGVTAVSDVLIVAGGGGGGAHVGGGGGAGGLRQLTDQNIDSTVNIVVGAGGRGAFTDSGGDVNQGASVESWATQGRASSFTSSTTTTTATGGGRGAFWWNVGAESPPGTGVAGSGGSGGGAVNQSTANTVGGSGVAGQGNNGGNGGSGAPGANSYQTGGGGGASEVGGTASDSGTIKSGDGGAGAEVSWLNSVSQTLAVGQFSSSKTYFAGGGGGGFHSLNAGNPRGIGGIGGGGNGAGPTTFGQVVNGASGTATSGGGGGGSGAPSTSTYRSIGGSGGSGVVVIRYLIPPSAPVISSVTSANQSLSVAFSAPTNNGATITDYEYSINNGSNWTSIGGTTSPFSISNLTNGTSYTVLLRALNGSSFSPASSGVAGTPIANCTSPSETSSGGYTYVAFKTVGSCKWTLPVGLSAIDLLVVAGGGGGGSRSGGGGGAGGVLDSTAVSPNEAT